MPEICLNMGITEIEIGEPEKAIEWFKKAISLKKDYVPAYMRLIDLLVRYKLISEATIVAKMGLINSPNSEQLQKMLAELQSLSQ